MNASSFAYNNRELICTSYSKIVKSIDNSVITVYTVHIQYMRNNDRKGDDSLKIIISNAKGQPIYEQIYQQMKNMIISGELAEGDMLPSIRGLAKDLRISVITTKRAYDELEKDGFTYSVAGKGSFVSERNMELIKEENLKKIEDYMEKIIELSKGCGLTMEDLKSMISIMGKDEL